MVRISFPKALEAQLVASTASFFGWIRTSVLYTADTEGLALFDGFSDTTSRGGIRMPQTNAISSNTNDTDIAAWFAFSKSVESRTMFALLGAGPPYNSTQVCSTDTHRGQRGGESQINCTCPP